jgi:GH3 auxin-responsive promoter
MSLKNRIINTLYLLGTAPVSFYYKRQIKRFSNVQLRILKTIIKRNRCTDFGKAHRFDCIHDVASFRHYVPVREYDDFQIYMDRIAAGEREVLTTESVLLFEPTGGTTSGSKLIPYTRSLKKEFQKAIHPWLYSIYKTNPQLLHGKSYWSISPALTQQEYTEGGIPIGFEEDSDYLGIMGKILRQVLIVPNAISRVKHMANFKYITAYFLLKEKELALISIWNPSFLLLILETIEEHLTGLIDDIGKGSLTLPVAEDVDYLFSYVTADPKRAEILGKIIADAPNLDSLPFLSIWPYLCFISCWDSGFAAHYAAKIQALFPGITIQGKGLLATEGAVTIPLMGSVDNGHFPAFTSHFMEFIPIDNKKEVRLLHQLEEGKEYCVLLTTGGGLYRYNLKDKVRVTGFYQDLPLLSFEGRDNVSDVMGEKLSYSHVQNVVTKVLQEYHFDSVFTMLAPRLEGNVCYYTLFLEAAKKASSSVFKSIIEDVDQALCSNFHYRYAREIGQLGELKLFLIKDGGNKAYFNRCIEEGQRAGDIKANLLDRRTDWETHFKGSFI